ncbi:TD and POZ domain-containing protein 3-like isoform X2 [Temnothorax curvispinosus]|uniref:TD and POZ domain-containing protein 3-like isoform X2 n=1 Tax=Temnothorax curvispinosus TaxID=300111 RepID=A0A6J1QAL6_9HYME|nr:TD and POZ domain-containing protein 3-like isoform X2 [Temnothorax curvispinosus]
MAFTNKQMPKANEIWNPSFTPRSEGMKHENSYTDNEIVSKKEQTVSSSFLPSYTKSYSQTRLEVTTSDYTWKIDQFGRLAAIVDTLNSPPFGENNQYKIQMNILRKDFLCAIRILIRTGTAFTGLCTTTIMHPPETVLASRSISCRISDMTLLIDVLDDSYISTEAFIIHCKIEHFHQLISNTIHMNLQPSTTVFKEVKSFEGSTLEFISKNEKSIKFIVGEEQYVISKKLLCDTNSNYFKIICLIHDGKEKDMTNELATDNELQTFKQILIFILTGSVEQCDYEMLKKLLTAADKYDVPTLKLTCEHYLLRYITIKNAVELIQLALLSKAKFLETHSTTFIKFHIKEITNTKEFKSLSQEDLNKVLEFIEKLETLESSTIQSFSSAT